MNSRGRSNRSDECREAICSLRCLSMSLRMIFLSLLLLKFSSLLSGVANILCDRPLLISTPILLRDLVGFYLWWGVEEIWSPTHGFERRRNIEQGIWFRGSSFKPFFFFLFLCDIGFKEIDTLGTLWSGFRWALLIKMLKFCVWTPFFVFNDLVGLYIHILWTSICRSRRPHPVEALTNRVLTWDNLTWTGVIYSCTSWWHGLNRYPKLNYE